MVAPALPRTLRAWGGPARTAIGALALIAILFLFVFPTRSFLAQRRELDDARHDLEVIREQNDALAEAGNRLSTPSEIERLAREQYQMVYPGERAFAVTPAETPTTVAQPEP